MLKEFITHQDKKYHSFSFAGKGLIAAFSTRSSGNMSLCYGDTANSFNNRKNFLAEFGIDFASLVCARQVHGAHIKYAKEADRGRGSMFYDSAITGTDAFITDKKDVPLAIFTADCLSVFLYDPKTPAIGLAHAGWRSTKSNIVKKAIGKMQVKFGSLPEDLLIGFGPAIRNCCCQVSSEFNDYFSFGVNERDDRFYLDLVAINKRESIEAGGSEKNIFDSRICTSCKNENFFSYRKEEKASGRMMSVVMLK
ncbi:MAG: peptidoglycan editing factor PgeF [Candidatus Omnitrophota bacterium]